MTWGDFKKLVDETDGVTDDVAIWYIDISSPRTEEGLDHPKVRIEEQLGLEVS